MKALLAANADVNARGRSGVTALMVAAFKGHLEMVRVLLAARADVNAKMTDGNTALIVASQNGHLEVVRALIERGSPGQAR